MSAVPSLLPPWPAHAPVRDGRRRGLFAAIAVAHLVLLWAWARSTAWLDGTPSLAPLFVQLLSSPSETRAEPAPLRAPAPETMPRPTPVPVPTLAESPVMATPVVEPTAPRAEVAVASEPAPGPATPAPVQPRAPATERQIAITQVEYLAPPVLAYPLAARRLREQGQVQVRVRVDEQGRPERMLVLRSSGSERLDDAALATVRATRFKPYTEDGVARAFWVVMPLVFELDS